MPLRKIKLKKALSLLEIVLCGIGIILGVGIYVLVGKAAGIAGNATWLAFVIGAIVAGLTGLSYAELSSIFPKAGAEYVYTEKTLGKRLAFLVGWLIIIGTMFAAATVSLGFGGYLSFFVNFPILLSAGVLIVILSFINFYGIKESARLVSSFTIIEVIGLLIIILIGIPYFGSADINYFETPANVGIEGIFQAAALLFFAYLGFEEVARLSEETKKAEETIPKAIVISIAITTLIYILVALSAVSVINWQTLALSDSPLADVAQKALGGSASIILAVIALFATANTALLMLIANSRLMYGMASYDSLPKILGDVHKTRKTPWIAIAATGILSIAFIGLGDIKFVANVTNFTVFITFTIINASLIWLRYAKPNLKRPFKAPFNIGQFPTLAVLGIASCIIFMLNLGLEIIIGGTALIIAGLVVYEFLIKKELIKEHKT